RRRRPEDMVVRRGGACEAGALLPAHAAPAGLGLPRAAPGLTRVPEAEQRRLALLQTGPAQEVVRHLGARGRSVPVHERLEDPLVLVDAARMRALPFARADRVERQRGAEGLRETLDRAVVRGLGQQRVELPRELSGVGAVAERR